VLGLGLVARADDDKAGKDKDKEIAWAKDFGAAVKQARADKKIIMVDFYTDWCGWCKKLDKDTYTDKSVVALSKDTYVGLKLDAEDKSEGQELAKKYKVRGFPTIVFLDPSQAETKDGGLVGQIVGYLPAKPFADQVKLIAQGHKDLPELASKAEKGDACAADLARLAQLYQLRGANDKAEDTLNQAEKADPKEPALAKAYNAVGDIYQSDGKFGKAIDLFRKGAEAAKDAETEAYARTSLAVCYFSQGEFGKAVPELESVTKLEGLSAESKDQAKQMLDVAREQAKKKAGKDQDKK